MKNSIRRQYLYLRSNLSHHEVNTLSYKVFQNLKEFPQYLCSNNFMVYLDFKNEVKTTPIIEDILNKNKNVIIPISKPETIELELSKLNNLSDLEVSTYGILEPKKDKLIAVDPTTIDFILVPGVVFDKDGYRIGYGKGYYDRFLSNFTHEFTTVGLCYDFQLTDKVPRDIYDYQLDYIVTDTRILNIKSTQHKK